MVSPIIRVLNFFFKKYFSCFLKARMVLVVSFVLRPRNMLVCWFFRSLFVFSWVIFVLWFRKFVVIMNDKTKRDVIANVLKIIGSVWIKPLIEYISRIQLNNHWLIIWSLMPGTRIEKKWTGFYYIVWNMEIKFEVL